MSSKFLTKYGHYVLTFIIVNSLIYLFRDVLIGCYKNSVGIGYTAAFLKQVYS